MVLRELPPARAEAAAVDAHGFPVCSACRRRLQNFDQWRCPYVSCRAWLHGADWEPAGKRRRRAAGPMG